jgi:hypothetical protein
MTEYLKKNVTWKIWNDHEEKQDYTSIQLQNWMSTFFREAALLMSIA